MKVTKKGNRGKWIITKSEVIYYMAELGLIERIPVSAVEQRLELKEESNMQGQSNNIEESTNEHLSLILNALRRWQEELKNPKTGATDIAKYMCIVETEKLFPYVLQHCPSVEQRYTPFKWLRDEEYKKKKALIETDKKALSECTTDKEDIVQLKGKLTWEENKLKEYLEIIIFYTERILPDTINTSLLSNEYLKHKCNWCPPD